MTPAHDAILRVLTRVRAADPAAAAALCLGRVPCNEVLAGDPTVQVLANEGGNEVGMMGILNGILAELGEPMVAMQVSDPPEPDGTRDLHGFARHVPNPQGPS